MAWNWQKLKHENPFKHDLMSTSSSTSQEPSMPLRPTPSPPKRLLSDAEYDELFGPPLSSISPTLSTPPGPQSSSPSKRTFHQQEYERMFGPSSSSSSQTQTVSLGPPASPPPDYPLPQLPDFKSSSASSSLNTAEASFQYPADPAIPIRPAPAAFSLQAPPYQPALGYFPTQSQAQQPAQALIPHQNTYPYPAGDPIPVRPVQTPHFHLQPPAHLPAAQPHLNSSAPFPMGPPLLPRRIQELNPQSGFSVAGPHKSNRNNKISNAHSNAHINARNSRNHPSRIYPHPYSNPDAQSHSHHSQANKITITSRPSVFDDLAIEIKVPRNSKLPNMPHPKEKAPRSYRPRGPHTFNPSKNIEAMTEWAKTDEGSRRLLANLQATRDSIASGNPERVDSKMNEIRGTNGAKGNGNNTGTGNQNDTSRQLVVYRRPPPPANVRGLRGPRGDLLKIPSPHGEDKRGRENASNLLQVQKEAHMSRVQAAGKRLQAMMGNPAPMTFEQEAPFFGWDKPRVPTEWDNDSEPDEDTRAKAKIDDEQEAITDRVDQNLNFKESEVNIHNTEMEGIVEGISGLRHLQENKENMDTEMNMEDAKQDNGKGKAKEESGPAEKCFENTPGFRQAIEDYGVPKQPLSSISFYRKVGNEYGGEDEFPVRWFESGENCRIFQVDVDVKFDAVIGAQPWLVFQIECPTATFNSTTSAAPPPGFPATSSWVMFGCPLQHVRVYPSTQLVVPVNQGSGSVMKCVTKTHYDLAESVIPFFEFSKEKGMFLCAGSVAEGDDDWMATLEAGAKEDAEDWNLLRGIMADGVCRIIVYSE